MNKEIELTENITNLEELVRLEGINAYAKIISK